MRRCIAVTGPASQKGAATLVVSLVTLVLVTLVTLYGSRSVLVEQKIMNNDARSRQAFEAAEAGLGAGIEYVSGEADRDFDGVLDPYVFDTDADGIGNVNFTVYPNGARVIVTLTQLSAGDMSVIRVEAQGFSDDSSATRSVTRVITALDPLPNVPDNPLTTRGSVLITGAATVVNPEGHSTIWTGANVDLGSNNETHTEVADTTDLNYPGCMDTPRTCTTVATSNKVTEGLDIVEYDESLANLSADEFFQNFFGMGPEAFRESMVTVEGDAANADVLVQLATNEVIWIEGDANFENNTTLGCTVVVTSGGVCPAANTKPSIVIVNGDATFTGTPHFYGLVFVTGSMDVSGETTVYGALIAAGDATHAAGGSFLVTYDSDILQGMRSNGLLGSSAGTWRDFL